MTANPLRALGGWLLRKAPVERRKILDDDGSVIAVWVGRPLSKAQRALLEDSVRTD